MELKIIASVAVKNAKVLSLVKLQLQVLRKLLQQLNIVENLRLAMVKLLLLYMMTHTSTVVFIILFMAAPLIVIVVLIKNFMIKIRRLIARTMEMSF